MARRTYNGYGITEMRLLAKEYGIRRYTRMTGDELLDALRAYWRQQVVDAEQAVMSAFPGGVIEPGTLLRHISTGAIVRVTSVPAPYVRDGIKYESLAFTAEYVEMGTRQPGMRLDAEHQNRMDALSAENGYTIQHMLYQHEAVMCVDCDAPAARICQPLGGTPEGGKGPKCERHAGPVRGLLGHPDATAVQRAVRRLNQELAATAPALSAALEA